MPEVTESTVKVDGGEAEKVETAPNANETSKNGVSSSSPEKKSPEKNEAEVLLAQGKRHLFIKDYPNAVSALGNACAKLDKMYGYLADECGDAYFSYGRALLELAREDSNVLGTEPEEKADSEEGEEEEGEEGDEKKDEEEKGDEVEEKEEEDELENDENKDNEGKEKETPGDETVDTTKEGNEEEEEEKENVENLQLAWEVFEIAKKIFERQNAKDKLADTYLYLGEVQMESENYNGAIDDLRRCMKVQKEILPSDHRVIAETYFQVGVAYSLCNEFDLAVSNFKTCHEILENRIKNLEKNGAPKEETEKNPFYSVDKEISEIKALLPEIKAKVADMEDFKLETIKGMMVSFNAQLPNADGAGTSSSSSEPAAPTPSTNGTTSKPINDISHLVRKKRKPEEETNSETSAKKSCTDDANK